MKSAFTQIPYARWPVMLAAVAAIAGVTLSLLLRGRLAQAERTEARLAAETLRMNVEQEISLFVEVLDSIRALHALSDNVQPGAMAEFVEKGMIHQHAVLGAFGLAQRISASMRNAIEESAAAAPETAYRVLQQGPDGHWIPAAIQPVYYPLTWQSQPDFTGVPVGFDFSSRPETLQAIQRMERGRQAVVVQSTLLADGSAGDRYWVFSPIVYRPPRSDVGFVPEVVIGFAVAVLEPAVLVERVESRLLPMAGRAILLRPGVESESVEAEIVEARGKWIYRQPIRVVDQEWLFECSLPMALEARRSMVVLAAGLFLTLLLTGQLLAIAGRTRRIENEVRARTDDLRAAKARLEEHLHERARMEEEMNELAGRERRRLGRDLHDSLGQKLTGAVFLSRSLLRQAEETGGEQETHARTLNETLKAAVAQVRDMARGLAPVSLSDESLGQALESLAEEMTGLYGVSCEVVERVSLPGLDRRIKEQLYLIAREAVNNAARHAQARKVTVRLFGGDGAWGLRVEDDGRGLPGMKPDGEGMGLRIMRHRARMIGAVFSIRSAPGEGTCILVERRGDDTTGT